MPGLETMRDVETLPLSRRSPCVCNPLALTAGPSHVSSDRSCIDAKVYAETSMAIRRWTVGSVVEGRISSSNQRRDRGRDRKLDGAADISDRRIGIWEDCLYWGLTSWSQTRVFSKQVAFLVEFMSSESECQYGVLGWRLSPEWVLYDQTRTGNIRRKRLKYLGNMPKWIEGIEPVILVLRLDKLPHVQF